MALDTFDKIWRGVLLRCPMASQFLARDWVSHSFREVMERRRWSWLVKRGQFLMSNQTNTGLATVVRGSPVVVGSGTAWTTALIGQQFRIGLSTPIYTVIAVPDTTHLTLSEVWGGSAATAAGYTIYNAYVTVPSDFHDFISVWDPRYNWQLNLHVQQEEINDWDAQRASTGTAYVVADYSYDTTSTPPLPRYEIWPHQTSAYVFPFLYMSRLPDLEDSGASLPRFIRGDVLLNMALAEGARWPGPDSDHKNPFFNLALAKMFDDKASFQIMELERVDDEVYESDLTYQRVSGMPFASFPLGDSKFLQSHDY